MARSQKKREAARRYRARLRKRLDAIERWSAEQKTAAAAATIATPAGSLSIGDLFEKVARSMPKQSSTPIGRAFKKAINVPQIQFIR